MNQSDPRRPEPVKDSDQIRDEIREAAFRLRYGQDDERAEALETLSHLVAVLRNNPPARA